ncbi:Sorting nexin mvp1, partial [Rhizopus azygosporus]
SQEMKKDNVHHGKKVRHIQVQTMDVEHSTDPIKVSKTKKESEEGETEIRRLEAALDETLDNFEVICGLAYKKLRELWEEKMRWENACMEFRDRLLALEQDKRYHDNDYFLEEEEEGDKEDDLGLSEFPDITIDTVPDEYNRIYHDIKSKYEKIDISCLEQLLKASSLSTTIQQQILDIIHLNNHNNPLFVTRNAFHLFLSLVALAQSDIDISLVSIAKYKHNLPIPYFDPIDPPISPPSHSSILSPHDIQQQLLNQWLSSLDTILLSKVPEKEGNFLFKHVNYQLESEKLGTKVIRRFSDFWWLWEVLLRRYPFRLIPHLPPKRLTA